MTTDPMATPDFKGRRVMVTGASGFLGSHLCSGLLRARAEVHAVSRVARVSTEAKLHWWQADLEDVHATRNLLADAEPEVIFHLGGLVNGAPDLELVVPTFQSLVTTTVNVLTAAAETGGPRVLLVGSIEEPTEGGDEVCPTSPYGAAKWAASAYGRMFRTLFDLPVVIIRTYMTYGPGQPTWKVIPSTINALLNGERPRLSSGQRELDWVYVDDVVEGLLLGAWTRELDGGTLDLGTGRLTSIREVVAHLGDLVAPSTAPVFCALPDRPRSVERRANVARTYVKIGWTPTTSLTEGLARTVDWYRRQHTSMRRAQA